MTPPERTPDPALHLGLVRSVAVAHLGPAGRVRLPMDDVFQVGCLGLIRACRKYDPAGAVTVGSYAYPAIRRHMWAALLAESNYRHCRARCSVRRTSAVSLQPLPPPPERADDDDSAGLHDSDVADHRPGPEEAAQRAEAVAAVRAAIERLPPRQRAVVTMRLGLGCAPQTLAAIGRAFGRVQETIRKNELAAHKALRELLDPYADALD